MKVRILIGAPKGTSGTTGYTEYEPIEQSWSLNRKAGAVINNTSLTLYDKASSIKIQRGHDIVIEDYNDCYC